MLLEKLDRLIHFDADSDAGLGGAEAPAEGAAAPAEEGTEFDIVEPNAVVDDEAPVEDQPESTPQPTQGARTGTGEPQVDWKAQLAEQQRAHQEQMRLYAAQIQEYQQKVREQELAGLDATQRAAKLQQWRNEDLVARERALEQQQYATKLANYYSGFVPPEAFSKARNPAEAQHLVLTHLASENQSLKKQIAALTKSVKKRPVEPVGSSGGIPTNPTKIDLDSLTPEEVIQINNRLKTGEITFAQVFGVSG